MARKSAQGDTAVAVRDDPDYDAPGTAIVERRPSAVANPFGETGTGTSKAGNALAAALEQRAVAEIQTQFLMAERFKRDERAAMDRIIVAFGRVGLAKGSQYEYSRGGTAISGPSIRAAEAIAQQWGNIDFGFGELGRYTDEHGVGVSSVRARAIDLQSRVMRHVEFQIRHWRDTSKGGYALKDERDIYEVIANQAQRRVRACILALIPGDVIEAAMAQASETLTANADTTPDGIARMVDAFSKYGVSKEHLEARIQRRMDAISPGQVVSLERIWQSLRDGMSKPSEWFDLPEADAAAADKVATALAQRRAERRKAGPQALPAETQPAASETQPSEAAPAGEVQEQGAEQ